MDNFRNTFLISPDDIKASTYVNYNVDDSLLAPAIREAQEIGLQSIIGSNLLLALQTMVYNTIQGNEGGIDDDENAEYKTLLDLYITPYLEARTQAVLCVPLSMKVRNYGVTKNSDTNIQTPTMKDIMFLQGRFNTLADRHATALSMYLCENRKLFPELEETSCGCRAFVKPQIGKRFVNIGLWLGDGKDGGCCLNGGT